MNNRWFILSVLLLSFCLRPAAQKDELMRMALDHFGAENQKTTWWLKDFKGYLDHIHEVRMVIATDNETYKGAYELVSSGLRFYLDGQLEYDEIHLVETDLNGRITGYISGELNEQSFYCTWSDPKNIERLSLKVFENKHSTNDENVKGWLEFYREKSKSKNFGSLMLENKEGKLHLHYNGKKILMECFDETCGILSSISASDQEDIYTLDRIKKIFQYNKENDGHVHLSLDKKMYFEHNAYIDFDERISVVFPKAIDEKFNRWANLHFTSLFNKVTYPYVKKTNSDALADRGKNIYVGDIYIDHFNDSLISGLFYIQSSATDTVTEVPFCYDFIKNKPVTFDDLFYNSDDFFEVVKNYMLKHHGMHSKVDPKTLIYTLGQDALVCRTPFNTLYGREEWQIPIKDLTKVINKKGILKKYGNQ